MFAFLSLGLCAGLAAASAIKLNVASHGGNASSPLAYGLMFEDINHSGDGGIYAELIQNRAFQGSTAHPSVVDPWYSSGGATLSVKNLTNPLSWALPTSLRVTGGKGKVALANPGWWGFDVKPQKYSGSFWVSGDYKGKFTAKLQSNLTSKVFATTTIPSKAKAGKWVEHKFELHPKVTAPNSNNTFVLEFDSGKTPLDFNLISLFPPTYKNRPNGLRIELMEALKALKPSFLRMPGGNNIEGEASHYRWKWNETIGPLTERPGRPGTWGYQNTDGLGLVEYLEWCDDLEMEPILGVWAGLYLNGYVPPADVIPEAELAPYVQEVMDELEFITGPVTSKYGKLRASLGHPKPWKLKYVEIGNEDNLGDQGISYAAYRFNMYYEAIHAKYPDMVVISSTGDTSVQRDATATDYHRYARADEFASMFGYWDNKANREHLTLIGEYAVIQKNLYPPGTQVDWSGAEARLSYPTWVGAISEGVFSLGAERNGYGIIGASYAPGFQNINSWQWAPDLISFTADPSQTVLSTSYHGIQLFSSYRYKATVPVSSNTPFGPSYWVAGTSGPGKYTWKAAVYNATETQHFNIKFDGVKDHQKATLTVLTAPDGWSMNMLGQKEVVKKEVKEVKLGKSGTFDFDLENYSLAVLTT